MADETQRSILEEMVGDVIDIDSTDLDLYSTSDILAEVQATISSLLAEETGFATYGFAGEVTAVKGKPFTEQEGTFALTLTGASPDGTDYLVKLHGDWNAADFETVEVEEKGEVPVVIRLTIVCSMESVSAAE